MAEPKLLTDREAADLLRMLPARLLRLTKAGVIPCVKLPDGDMRYVREDLWRWVELHKSTEEAASK